MIEPILYNFFSFETLKKRLKSFQINFCWWFFNFFLLFISLVLFDQIEHNSSTVVSDRKAIVGLRHYVTIAIHISTEISKNSHPKDLKFGPLDRNTYSPRMSILTIAKFAPSTLESALFTYTTVNYEKVENGRISGIHEGSKFVLIF